MLVSATEMLKKAKAGHYAVGQFNINNLEWTKSILLTAKELRSPVILGVSEGAGKYMGGYDVVVGMVNGLLKDLDIDVPVALHLDHGSFEGCYKCIEAGFSSIMFDGSHYPIAENVEKTTELVKAAHSKGLSIEAEVGSIGGEEDGVIGMGECADPKECKSIADLGVDFLAAGIGNIHGKYPANWKGLSFETLAAVQELTGELPLVLHGGTGIPADQIKKAIDLGYTDEEGNIYYYLFHCYYGLKNVSQDNVMLAKDALITGIGKFPKNERILDGLMQLYTAEEGVGDPADLVTLIDSAIADNPENVDLWFGRGRIFYALKNYDESIASFKKVVELKPDLFEGNYYLGVFYTIKADEMNKVMNEKQYSSQTAYDTDLKEVNAVYMEAVPWFEKAYELKKDDVNTLDFLKSICFRLRDEEGMMDKYNKYNTLLKEAKGEE